MLIQVQLFAHLRDCLPLDAERGKAQIEIPTQASLLDLFSCLEIERCLGEGKTIVDQIESWQISVNGEFTQDFEYVLKDGDQVIVFPHMAGG
jgi:molybdopterin converting factor small subunit